MSILPGNKVAIIIPNSNMPEYTSNLCQYITNTMSLDYDLIVVNNPYYPLNATDHPLSLDCDHTVSVQIPLGMTHAILMGLYYVDALSYLKEFEYFAYWIVTTSLRFPIEKKDFLTPMVKFMLENEKVVMTSPAIIGTAWDSLHPKGSGWRKVWGVDNNAILIRSDWFNGIGRYRPELTIGWGSSLETCWIARSQGKEIWVNDDLVMTKDDGIAHEMGRRDTIREDFNMKGAEQMHRVLGAEYGENFLEKLGKEYR